MPIEYVFGVGVFVTALCAVFVLGTAYELRRLRRLAPSEHGRILASSPPTDRPLAQDGVRS